MCKLLKIVEKLNLEEKECSFRFNKCPPPKKKKKKGGRSTFPYSLQFKMKHPHDNILQAYTTGSVQLVCLIGVNRPKRSDVLHLTESF